jgi:hypothetical protein
VQLLEALRYNSERRGFDGVIAIFHYLVPSGCSMDLRSIHPLTKMTTRDISREIKAAGA